MLPFSLRAPSSALRGDNDVDSVPLQLDDGAKACRPAAKHEGGAAIDRQP